MGYAEPVKFGATGKDRVRSAVLVAAVQGCAIAALILVPVAVVTQTETEPDPRVVNISIPVPPPPPRHVAKPPQPTTRIDAPAPPLALPRDDSFKVAPLDDFPVDRPSFGTAGDANILGPEAGAGDGDRVAIPDPVIVAPKLDQRYARDFLPPYPAARRRLGEEGVVRVNVLVGADGRVKDIAMLSASHPSFWRATQRHAKRRWRFTPGMRDGQAVEQWFVVTARFTMRD